MENMETAARDFINTNREGLKNYGSSQMFLDWADLALYDGADPSGVLLAVMAFNICGPEGRKDVADDTAGVVILLQVKHGGNDNEKAKAA